MAEKGRAAVFHGVKKPFEIREYAVPDPGDRDLVVRITRANICGSDLHLWRGDTDLARPRLPSGTIDDPKTYTRPWKIVWPMVRQTEPGFEFLEEACREGERDVPLFRRLGYTFYRGSNLPALRPR